MEKFIGKKRNIDHKAINIDNKKEEKNKDEKNMTPENNKNNEMKRIIDDCFNDFINGNTNKLLENYNLLKQKFYEVVQN